MFWIPIDRTINVPLIQQVYEQIRTRILDGDLVAGDRLPSTRELSSSLGISRNVVVNAYEQLFAEGYIEGKQGSGTYVAKGAYLELQKKTDFLSIFDTRQLQVQTSDMIDFRPGIPALDMFPRKIWGNITKQYFAFGIWLWIP